MKRPDGAPAQQGSPGNGVSRLRAHVDLVHPTPILIVLIATFALSFAIAPEGSHLDRVLLLLSMLGGQLAIGVVNEVVDLEVDRQTQPSKPMVTGLVTQRAATWILVAGLLLMVVASLPLGWLALVLCSAGTAIGIAYSRWFKRTLFAWLPYVLALPLLPIWISAGMSSINYRLFWLYPIGLCAIISVQIAQALPDVEADRSAGIDSLTTRLGERRAIAVCWAALVSTSVLVVASSERVALAAFCTAIIVVSILTHMVTYRFRPKLGVKSAFPLSATGTLLLGLTWLA